MTDGPYREAAPPPAEKGPTRLRIVVDWLADFWCDLHPGWILAAFFGIAIGGFAWVLIATNPTPAERLESAREYAAETRAKCDHFCEVGDGVLVTFSRDGDCVCKPKVAP